jgi:hypothetical protein
MRALIVVGLLALGAASAASAAPCRNPATGRVVPCPGTYRPAAVPYGAPTAGIGRTVVVAGPAVRPRPILRCGRVRCNGAVMAPAPAAPVAAHAPVAQPAAGYAPQ